MTKFNLLNSMDSSDGLRLDDLKTNAMAIDFEVDPLDPIREGAIYRGYKICCVPDVTGGACIPLECWR